MVVIKLINCTTLLDLEIHIELLHQTFKFKNLFMNTQLALLNSQTHKFVHEYTSCSNETTGVMSFIKLLIFNLIYYLEPNSLINMLFKFINYLIFTKIIIVALLQ